MGTGTGAGALVESGTAFAILTGADIFGNIDNAETIIRTPTTTAAAMGSLNVRELVMIALLWPATPNARD